MKHLTECFKIPAWKVFPTSLTSERTSCSDVKVHEFWKSHYKSFRCPSASKKLPSLHHTVFPESRLTQIRRYKQQATVPSLWDASDMSSGHWGWRPWRAPPGGGLTKAHQGHVRVASPLPPPSEMRTCPPGLNVLVKGVPVPPQML